ncbi:hypothetical protein APHAL10511_005307 [Amanita phalloides]|nr:hypothetical protein APHAL10511_005307 [Amanita phalloides]
MPVSDAVLTQILAQLDAIQIQQQTLQAKVDALSASNTKRHYLLEPKPTPSESDLASPASPTSPTSASPFSTSVPSINKAVHKAALHVGRVHSSPATSDKEREKLLYPGRVNLSTYPDNTELIRPLSIGEHKTRRLADPSSAPVSRPPIKHRNAIGAHSGSYSIYRALSIAMGALSPSHKPDYAHRAPRLYPAPTELVRQAQDLFRDEIETKGLDVRPSIAVTRAHMKLSELDEAAKRGDIKIDGKIVLESLPLKNEDGSERRDVSPVWKCASAGGGGGRFESLLVAALFEETGGMYPELITSRHQNLPPPIGGLTVYIFGNPAYVSDTSKELTLRVHDECNGSDVFGSDICTCKPYLVYAIEECIRCAQRGGVGVVVYFRKEGRALGEVTKYLVYNLRKAVATLPIDTSNRPNSLPVSKTCVPSSHADVLHWLGITKVDNLVSMSDMKFDAIVKSGIEITRRYDILTIDSPGFEGRD